MLKIYNTYIHIPFCERKCNYCDFTSLKGTNSQIERYVNYLLKEIEIYKKKYDLSEKQDTIYFGGGTPSLLPIDSLEKILSKFSYDKNTEITIEVNPKTVDTNKLKELLKQPTDKPYSIVLDIDETVLSNIPFQVKMVKDGTAFNPKLWDEWVQKAEAKPVAGAKEFLQFADKNKVQIYYISDRTDAQVDATIKNLEAQGLPVQGRDHLMFKKEGDKSKEGRRQEVLKHTNLVMLFGDNLVDFAEFSTKSEADRDKMFEQLKAEFGDKFIIFPNPMYGSWESAVYQGEKKDGKGQSEARLNALKGY